MITLPENFENKKNEIGPKGLNLSVLKTLGLNVPEFLAIPSSTVAEIWKEKQTGKNSALTQTVDEILKALPAKLYAVRSAALNEDTVSSSQAGQFKTKLGVAPAELASAVLELLEDANVKLSGKIGLFSIVVQGFIPADLSGIVFTRNPSGGREMLIEFAVGTGEMLVGGEVQPKKIKVFWSEKAAHAPIPNFETLIKSIKEIERHFGCAQDIEWCVRKQQLYFLQSRPITTISPTLYQESLYLDSNLPPGKFFFEKTEISEIAPRPTPFTLDLLKKIYGDGGPVSSTYAKYKISYKDSDFLTVVGNELYVDREKEIKSLLPSFSFLASPVLKPKLNSLSGIFKTIKNIYRINTLGLRPEEILENLEHKLARNLQPGDLAAAVADFLKDYELIFEINLLAEKALKKLKFYLASDKINESTALSLPQKEKLIKNLQIKEADLVGNSLEVCDTSHFFPRLDETGRQDSENIFSILPKWKQDRLVPVIKQAQTWARMREYGRWLTVKHISNIRNILYQKSLKNNFTDRKDIFFLPLRELARDRINEGNAIQNRKNYEQYMKFILPGTLSHLHERETKEGLLGVSAGIAEGILASKNEITEKTSPVILYTQTLTPDLAALFPSIKGIVSEKGGMLSHLAIMARENKIPVLVNFHLKNSGIKLGDRVTIDAGKNEITLS